MYLVRNSKFGVATGFFLEPASSNYSRQVGSQLLHKICVMLKRKLQLIQNNAGRLITKNKMSDHITPVLKNLHWLSISFRIDYNS